MKIKLLFILLLGSFSSHAQNLTLYTYFATCENYQGRFIISGGPIDSVVWSNGMRGTSISNVDTGHHEAYIYFQGIAVDTLYGYMYYSTWELSLTPCGNGLCYSVSLSGSASMYRHPNCAPSGSYKVIFWEDSIPKDTLTFTNTISNSGFYANVIQGHRYDMSIYDPGCDCYQGTWNNSSYPGSVFLNVKAYLQGLYNSGGTMVTALYNLAGNPNSSACDSVFVELRYGFNPSIIKASGYAIMNKDGNFQIQFPSANLMFQNHYIVIRHRNSIETWSKTAVGVNTSIVNYDFSDAANKAYDDNQVNLGDGHFAIFTGDIDQDGGVDALDMTLIENEAQLGVYGYLTADLNGDGGVDSLDMTIVEINTIAGVFEALP